MVSSRGLDTYVDSDWATRFSVCLVFYHGCLFHWFSKMQKSVSLSSAEAEYFGAMMAVRDLIYLRDMLLEFAIALHVPSIIWSDSKSAVAMAFDRRLFQTNQTYSPPITQGTLCPGHIRVPGAHYYICFPEKDTTDAFLYITYRNTKSVVTREKFASPKISLVGSRFLAPEERVVAGMCARVRHAAKERKRRRGKKVRES